jgi:tetratricopeptide (TPR) repeat protein
MRRIRLPNLLGLILMWAAVNCAAVQLACGVGTAEEAGNQEMAVRGMNILMDGDFDSALEICRQIQKSDPESPLGYLLEADVNWWKIYLIEANLIDPDVFEALSEAPTPYDADFRRLDELAIRKAEARLQAHQDQARSYFYEGLAYGLRARLEALRDHALGTARAGKKLRNLSLAALKLDPNLNDSWFGVGLYNYFEDTLPTYVKMLRFLILLPGGDRLMGLRQIQQAMEKGQLVRAEARFHLAKNYSRSIDRQYARSLELFRQMQQQYPHNPLWKLLIGSVELRMGNAKEGETLYRQVIEETAHPPSEIWKPLHLQAERALARRYGQ